MADDDVFGRINALSDEEERLWRNAGNGQGLTADDHDRLETIKVELDRCYDLLHQREARRRPGPRRSSSATSSRLPARLGPSQDVLMSLDDRSLGRLGPSVARAALECSICPRTNGHRPDTCRASDRRGVLVDGAPATDRAQHPRCPGRFMRLRPSGSGHQPDARHGDNRDC